MLLLHLAGATIASSSLWGVHHWAFLPVPWAITAFALATLAIARRGTGGREASPRLDRVTPAAHGWRFWTTRWLLAILAGSAAFALFWTARARHLFLGDGMVLVQSLPASEFHPLEPLTMVLQRQIHQIARPWLEGGGTSAQPAAWSSIALGSTLAGVLFVGAAFALARQLVRATRAEVDDSIPREAVALVTLVLLAQGYVQLFFGYVENYAFLALAIGWYLVTALAFLNGRGPLLPVIVSCSAAVCLHLSAAALFPSLAWLVMRSLGSRRRRMLLGGELVAGGVVVLVIVALLSAAGSGYSLSATLLDTVQRIAAGEGELTGYARSWTHVRDFVNGQMLIAPAGLALLVPALVHVRHRIATTPAGPFMMVLAVTCACVVAAAGDSNLGYARNWDLLAPMGIVFTATSAFLILLALPAPAARRHTLTAVLAVSLFHTVPWVAGNASFERAFARFQTLPLGGGRTESTIGLWYAGQGRPLQAEPWLVRSLESNPANPRAHYVLGQVYLMTGRAETAVRAFAAASRLRPHLTSFRLALVDALLQSGRREEALTESQALAEVDATDPRRWAVLGTVLLSLDRRVEAREALERAAVLAPADPRFQEMLAWSGQPAGLDRILRRHWIDLTSM